MDKAEKRAALEQRKNKWMQDRHMTLMRGETANEYQPATSVADRPSIPAQASKGGPVFDGRIATQGFQPGDDTFLSKLTEKLALHIRDEVKREMESCVSGSRAKDAVVEKMESYLQVCCWLCCVGRHVIVM
jgi:hypothetical protein